MEKRRVLLIDDEVTFARVMKSYLEKTGRYEVHVENGGRRGLDAARSFRPDVILLDVIMPDMDGGSVASELRTDPQLQHIPVVFLTAVVSREEVGAEARVIGGQRFIAKPVNASTVLDYIEHQMA